jgi:predicted transcriptional regulator
MTKTVNTREINKVKLTDLEIDVLKDGLYYNEYNNSSIESIDKKGYDKNYPVIWADMVVYDCNLTKPKQLPAVIASLNKKGLIKSEGEGKDAVVVITEAGIDVLRVLVAEDEEMKNRIVTSPDTKVSKIEQEIADGTTPFEFDGEPLIIAPPEILEVLTEEELVMNGFAAPEPEPEQPEIETEPEFKNRYLSILRPLGMWYSPRDPTVKYKIVNPTDEDKKHCPEWVSMVHDALITDKPLSEEEVKHMTFIKAHVVEEAEPEKIEEAEPEEVELIAQDSNSETFHLRIISKDEFFEAEEIGGELIKLGEGEKRAPAIEPALTHVTKENGFTDEEIELAKEIVSEFVKPTIEAPEPAEPEELLPEAEDRYEPAEDSEEHAIEQVRKVIYEIFTDYERGVAYEILKEWKKNMTPETKTEKPEKKEKTEPKTAKAESGSQNVYRLEWIANGEQKHKDYMKKPVAENRQREQAKSGITSRLRPLPIEDSDYAYKITGAKPAKKTEKKESGNKGGKSPSASSTVSHSANAISFAF